MAAGGQSDYLNSQMLTWLKGTTFAAAPATTYVALFTTAPTSDAGTGGTEVSGNAYARVGITSSSGWSAVSGGGTAVEQISNAGVVTFATPTGAGWGTVVAVGLYDASSAGNLLYFATITSQAIGTGVVASFAIGALVITAD
jgi:hypothetical protein